MCKGLKSIFVVRSALLRPESDQVEAKQWDLRADSAAAEGSRSLQHPDFGAGHGRELVRPRTSAST